MSRSPFSVEVLSAAVAHGGTVVLKVSGSLDATSFERAQAAFGKATATAARVVILDLEALEFLDSLGVSVLLELQIRVHRGGGRTYLTNLTPRVRRVLAVVHALPEGTIFESRPLLDAYLASVQAGAGDGGGGRRSPG